MIAKWYFIMSQTSVIFKYNFELFLNNLSIIYIFTKDYFIKFKISVKNKFYLFIFLLFSFLKC
jgi:hypothetical protein